MKIGKVKALIDRQRSYLAFFNFLMLGYLFFDKIGYEWWYFMILPFWVIFAYLDARYIMPSEFEYLHKKSPVFKEILRK